MTLTQWQLTRWLASIIERQTLISSYLSSLPKTLISTSNRLNLCSKVYQIGITSKYPQLCILLIYEIFISWSRLRDVLIKSCLTFLCCVFLKFEILFCYVGKLYLSIPDKARQCPVPVITLILSMLIFDDAHKIKRKHYLHSFLFISNFLSNPVYLLTWDGKLAPSGPRPLIGWSLSQSFVFRPEKLPN